MTTKKELHDLLAKTKTGTVLDLIEELIDKFGFVDHKNIVVNQKSQYRLYLQQELIGIENKKDLIGINDKVLKLINDLPDWERIDFEATESLKPKNSDKQEVSKKNNFRAYLLPFLPKIRPSRLFKLT